MIGQREPCEVCSDQTIRQCTICQRWVCNRCKGQCPCLFRYLAAGRDGYRMAHLFPPDLDVKADLPCGGRLNGAINLRLSEAPEVGAARCPTCFADDPMPGYHPDEGWGSSQITVAMPPILYPDPTPTRRTGPRRASHKPGADSTPEDYIEGESHKPTPEQVLLLDAATGLPIAEGHIAKLAKDSAGALDLVRFWEDQAATERDAKDRAFCQATARQIFEHRTRLLGKLAEWQSLYHAYLATLLARVDGEAV